MKLFLKIETNRMYFVSETGVLTILCAWVLAAVLYIRVKKRL